LINKSKILILSGYSAILIFLLWSTISLHYELEEYENASIEFLSEGEGFSAQITFGGGSETILQFCSVEVEKNCINLVQKLKESFDLINSVQIGLIGLVIMLMIIELRKPSSVPKN